MKLLHKLLLIASMFCNTLLPIAEPLTPENTEIIFDLDDVLIEKSKYGIYQTKLIVGGIAQNLSNSKNYIEALLELKKAYSKNELGKKGIYDNNGNKINHLTFQFLYNGMRNPKLTPYVNWMSETMEHSRWAIPGMLKICRYLKEQKGYTINFATNKDRVTYDLTAQVFGNQLTSIPSKVFVAHPASTDPMLDPIKQFAQLPTTDTNYKLLANKALTVLSTDSIIHIHSSKPAVEYFTDMEKIIGKNKNMIFIDDQINNIKAFNTLQNNSPALRLGIPIPKKDKAQYLAAQLVKCGILSETDDKQLLDEINHPWKTFIFNTFHISKN